MTKSAITPVNIKMPGHTKTPGLKSPHGVMAVKGLRKIKFPRPKLPAFGKKTFRD